MKGCATQAPPLGDRLLVLVIAFTIVPVLEVAKVAARRAGSGR